jgi:hypothetical protein
MRSGKIIPGLMLAILLAAAGAASGKATIIIFTGKVQEIRAATELDIGKTEKFIIVKLDSPPKAEFRLTTAEAARYGLIDPTGPSQIITPKKAKGLGWKVKLTCDNEPTGPLDSPVYRVKSLERIGGD